MNTNLEIGTKLLLLLLVLGCREAGGSVPLCNGVNKNSTLKLSALPELIVFEKDGRQEGLSAAYGGVLDGAVVVAGGCNFPGKPAAEGGEKVYYNEIYVLRDPDKAPAGWEEAGKLPLEAGCGASVTLPEGVVCIGGRNAVQALTRVWLLKWNTAGTSVVAEDLPELPEGMDNMAAATDGCNIYVAGGHIEGNPGNRCFVLKGIRARQWEELPAFPGSARIQPVGSVLDGKFYLMGGFQPVVGGQKCQVLDDGVVYDPQTQNWTKSKKMKLKGGNQVLGLVGASAVTLNNQMMVVQGGVNPSVFKAAVDNPLLQQRAKVQGHTKKLERLKQEQETYMKHEPEWYEFRSQLLFFYPEKQEWKGVGYFQELARAGAVFVLYDNKLIVVNGETKPGIRSANVSMIDLGY